MIRVEIQSKRFGGQPVLGPMRFDITRGETVALIGPSGIGKTTLLRIVTGIDADFTGHVERPEAQAIVFQEPTLLPWRTALDNLRLIHPTLSPGEARAALGRVGLDGKENHFPGQLSLGQQRRLALARACAGQPELLVMDEPFVSLDADAADAMLTLTQELIAEHRPATLFVTHAKPEADRLADRVLEMRASPQGARVA